MNTDAIGRLPARTLLDGAVGTRLIAAGLRTAVDCPESWNIERPAEVRRIHAEYIEAGADAVQTNTFGGTRLRLAAYQRSSQVVALNKAAVSLAREACPPGKLVIGSIGPTGAIPPPQGNADLELLEHCYAEQAKVLAGSGVDLLHLETMYHPKEARAALRGARNGAPGIQVIASMTCRRISGGGSGYATPLGFSPEVMLAVFLEENADAIGVCCSLEPASMLDLLSLVRRRTSKPIFAKPIPPPATESSVGPEAFARGVMALLAAGARAVGGCCGTGPAEIATARRHLDAMPRSVNELSLVT
ncbi:MAG: homocysteine S-methyltransferase family protein [Pseudomonadota bacterium]